MMHFVRIFSIMRAEGVKDVIVIEEVQNYGKLAFIKSIVGNCQEGMHPHISPAYYTFLLSLAFLW